MGLPHETVLHQGYIDLLLAKYCTSQIDSLTKLNNGFNAVYYGS